jgi:hypothetical protein
MHDSPDAAAPLFQISTALINYIVWGGGGLRNLFTEANKSVEQASLNPDSKLICSGDFHPSNCGYISFVDLNGLSSTLSLPCKSTRMHFKLTRVLHRCKVHDSMPISGMQV